MRLLVLLPLVALAVLAVPAAWAEEASSCTTHCHGLETTAFRGSVHAGTLSCVDCHGGDPTGQRDKEASHSTAAGFRGVPARDQIPTLCGDCHSDAAAMRVYGLHADQLSQWHTSSHGIAFATRGVTGVAMCTDCHGSHGVLHAHDPRATTAPRNQPALCGRCHQTEVEDFRKSVHGEALLVEQTRGAPGCVDCHGAHGAAPPGVTHVVEVCGRCHLTARDQFHQSVHATSEEMDCRTCHEGEGPEYARRGCMTCHGKHDIREPGDWMYAGQEPGRCDHCHRQDDKADLLTRVLMDGRKRLIEGMDETDAAIKKGKERGLYYEHEGIHRQESQRTLVSVRAMIHGLDAPAIEKHIAEGLSRQERAREEIRIHEAQLRDRRILLSGLSVMLLLLAALLGAKLAAVRRLS